jgi:DNA polymerase III subunit epsilon
LKILFFDTETTGLPIWGEPSTDHRQPHLVQIGAELVDAETREVLKSMDVIIKPAGWEIPEEMTAIHGITKEAALENGISEWDAVEELLEMKKEADLRVAHNVNFDDRIIRIAITRELGYDKADEWKEGEKFDTCNKSRKAVGLKKAPKLEESYEFFTGKKLEGAHSAAADVAACREVYFALVDAGEA